MSRRIDVELTSARPDGTWTWRAAGAREPRGVLDGSLLSGPAKVGDILRVEAEVDVDGITVTSVASSRSPRSEPERLELISTGQSFEPVTTALVERARGERRGRPDRDRPPRGDRDRPGGRADRGRPDGDRARRPEGDRPARERTPRPDGGRPDRRGGERPPRTDRPARAERGERTDRPPRAQGEGAPTAARRERPARPPRPQPVVEAKPKAKRLRAGRAHRQALLTELPPEQVPVAEQLFAGGMQAVRHAIEQQNAALRAEGKPEVRAGELIALAERLHTRVRAAEWRDRAEAALGDVDELDLRDLRSVVGADDIARDEASRELAGKLREALNHRVEKEHADWLAEIGAALDGQRVIRALRLSSRPPKAGSRFPAELGARLAEAAGGGLSPIVTADRWDALLEAIAFSPVRSAVVPAGVPDPVPDELRATVTRMAGALPQIAAAFGIEPPATTGPPRPRRPQPPRRPAPPAKPTPEAVAPQAAAPEAPAEAPEAPAAETEAPEVVVREAPAPETAAPEVAVPDGAAPEAAALEVPPAELTEPAEPPASSGVDAAPEPEPVEQLDGVAEHDVAG